MRRERKPEEEKALENIVKKNFCGKKSIVSCGYYDKIWCPKNCGFYSKMIHKTKYWNR